MPTMKLKKMVNDFSVLSLETVYFRLVYEEKSINGAARKISQDPGNISRSVAKLEKKLGAQLFVRHKTGLHPTPMADRLYLAISSAQKSFSQKIGFGNDLLRTIRIGFSQGIGHAHFSSHLTAQLGQLKLLPEFTIASSVELIELIKTRELDFALVSNKIKFPGLISKTIATESLVLCSATGRLEKTLILHPDMLGLERIVHSIPYDVRWMLRDYFVIAQMVQKSRSLMSVLPESLLATYPGLKVIKIFLNEGKITGLSWPGSVGVELLKNSAL